MRLRLTLCLVVLVFGSTVDADEDITSTAINIKNVPVNEIESSLGSPTFEEWLRAAIGPSGKVEWRVVPGCREMGDVIISVPPCVEASASIDGERGATIKILVQVGNHVSRLRLHSLIVAFKGSETTYQLDRLEDLPTLLRRGPLASDPAGAARIKAALEVQRIVQATLDNASVRRLLPTETPGTIPWIVAGVTADVVLNQHGKALTVVATEGDAQAKNERYLIIREVSVVKDTGTVVLRYPVKNLTATVTLSKENDEWTVTRWHVKQT